MWITKRAFQLSYSDGDEASSPCKTRSRPTHKYVLDDPCLYNDTLTFIYQNRIPGKVDGMSKLPRVCRMHSQREVHRPAPLENTILSTLRHEVYRSGTRAILLLASTASLAIASFLLLSPPVTADLPQAPEDSVEANGRVWDILRVGDRIYLAGSFTQVTNTDGQTFVRNNLAAIDANTGKVVPDWDPNATRPASPSTSSVRAMALSSDGSRLFVGGTFANVGGLNRNRLAAVDVATGAVNKQWTSGVNNTV
jgi:hypothetical protein